MNKKWQINKPDEAKVEKLCKEYNINQLLSRILVNRGITEKEDIKKFLNPTRNDFYDPYLMPDMETSVKRILEAMENKEDTLALIHHIKENNVQVRKSNNIW